MTNVTGGKRHCLYAFRVMIKEDLFLFRLAVFLSGQRPQVVGIRSVNGLNSAYITRTNSPLTCRSGRLARTPVGTRETDHVESTPEPGRVASDRVPDRPGCHRINRFITPPTRRIVVRLGRMVCLRAARRRVHSFVV